MIRFRPFTLLFILLAGLLEVAGQTGSSTTAKQKPATGRAPINDIQMYYEIHGDGPPLILLHGGMSHAGYWKNQIPALSAKYKVIAVDSRGQGRSTFSERQINYALMASDVIALMDYLAIKKATILGWSDGAIIGIYLAMHHRGRLNKVIAYGANYNPSGLRSDYGENKRIQEFFEQAAKEYQTLSPDPKRWDAFQKNISQMWESEPNFSAAELGKIKTPMLILDGDHDEAIKIEHTRELARLIPKAELKLISDTGHFAPLEKPEAFNRIVLQFLAK